MKIDSVKFAKFQNTSGGCFWIRECRETSAVEYTTLSTAFVFSFCLYILKFELQYEWTPPQVFFCRSHILQLFYHKVEDPNAVLIVPKNNWNGNCFDFIDLQGKNRFGRSFLNLMKLLAIYFAIIYSWQLSNSIEAIVT